MKTKLRINSPIKQNILKIILVIIIGIFHILLVSYLDIENKKISLNWILIPIISYLIINTLICMIVNKLKKLKSYKEDGLLSWLSTFFILGTVFGISIGVIGLLFGKTPPELILFSIEYSLSFCTFLGIVLGIHFEFK